jgi:hypothetical protein
LAGSGLSSTTVSGSSLAVFDAVSLVTSGLAFKALGLVLGTDLATGLMDFGLGLRFLAGLRVAI